MKSVVYLKPKMGLGRIKYLSCADILICFLKLVPWFTVLKKYETTNNMNSQDHVPAAHALLVFRLL